MASRRRARHCLSANAISSAIPTRNRRRGSSVSLWLSPTWSPVCVNGAPARSASSSRMSAALDPPPPIRRAPRRSPRASGTGQPPPTIASSSRRNPTRLRTTLERNPEKHFGSLGAEVEQTCPGALGGNDVRAEVCIADGERHIGTIAVQHVQFIDAEASIQIADVHLQVLRAPVEIEALAHDPGRVDSERWYWAGLVLRLNDVARLRLDPRLGRDIRCMHAESSRDFERFAMPERVPVRDPKGPQAHFCLQRIAGLQLHVAEENQCPRERERVVAGPVQREIVEAQPLTRGDPDRRLKFRLEVRRIQAEFTFAIDGGARHSRTAVGSQTRRGRYVHGAERNPDSFVGRTEIRVIGTSG